MMNLEFDFDDVKSWDPARIQRAAEKLYPDDPNLPPRSNEKKIDDSEWGECGEMIAEKILGLEKHMQKYQDFKAKKPIIVDDVEICGTIEIKVIRENSLGQLILAIERHLGHSSADFVVSLVGDRTTRKLYPHRITFCGDGLQKLRCVKRYMD